MTVTERVAYLKGLFEGLDIDTEKKEGKILAGMLDVLEEMAVAVTDLEQQNAELLNELDDIYEDLSAIEEEFIGDTDDMVQEDADAEEDDLYQVICPTCGETIYLGDEMLQEGSIVCASCGEELEFDLSDLEQQ